MTLDNPLLNPRKPIAESAFVKENRESISSRIQTLTNSLETTRKVIYIPTPLAEQRETVAGQAGKVFQRGAPIDLPPELATSSDLVGWAERARTAADTEAARQVVAQALTGAAHEVASGSEATGSNVIDFPDTAEITAGRQAVRNSLGETA